MYKVNFLVYGYPGTSPTHGSLGWSTIALVSNKDQHILVDGGSFGIRQLLIQQLRHLNLGLNDISLVLLTHAHWDHAVNWTLFPNATVVLSKVDLDWALQEPPAGWHVPELYIHALAQSPQLRLVADKEEILPGLTTHQVAGHTPGHLAYYLESEPHDWLFAGDAVKNRAELLSRHADMTMDESSSTASILYLWDLWNRRTGTVFVPGHDLPMTLTDGQPTYAAQREASITAWFGNDLTDTTSISLQP